MARRAAREWPLIAFTLLAQTAVGALWMIAAGAFFIVRTSAWTGERVATFPALAAVAAALAVATVLSLFHLGRPWRAAMALANLRRSWLSREILFELVFGGLVVFAAVWRPRSAGDGPVRQAALAFGAVAGFFFLFSMAKLYMLATVPAWRSVHTPLSFFLSAVLLGALTMAVAGSRLLDLGRSAQPFTQTALLAALAAVMLILITIVFFTPSVGYFGVKTPTLLALPAKKIYPFVFVRMAFLAATVVFLLLAGRDLSLGREISRWPALALASAAAAEIAGRTLFYAAYSRLGV